MSKVVDKYSVPYAGGYSEDGQTIYIDYTVPDYFTTYAGEQYPLRSILEHHEASEMYYMFHKGMDFNTAHKLAIQDDIALMTKLGIPIDEYYGKLHEIVEFNLYMWSKRHTTDLPPDLDMRPYIDDGLM
jgi:hypothetical protein